MNRSKWPIYLCHIVPLYAASLAIFWSQLRENSFIKRLLTVSIPVIVVLSSGVNFYRIKRDSYHQQYLPDIRVMLQLLSPSDLIFGPWETAFDLGFDKVTGDHTLGYFGKQQPNYILTDSVYEREFRNFQKTRPEVFAHIQDLLTNKYKLVYQGKIYKIYKKVK